MMHDQEYQYRTLKLLQLNPEMTQRQLADTLDVSLGKAHYVIKALISAGFIKIGNFKSSNNKIGYTYFLTPKGIREKAALASRFLEYKQEEYSRLRKEIRNLKVEVQRTTLNL